MNRRSLSTFFASVIIGILLWGQGYSGLDPAQALLAKIGALPFGYGQHTLGGCLKAGCKCEVTNLKDSGPGSLRSCVESDVSKWVVFGEGGRGTIELETPLHVGSNTTIDGRGPLPVTIQRAVGHVMYIHDSENVIVNDLEFRLVPKKQRCSKPKTAADTTGCGGGIAILGKSRNVWIHQNQFASCGGKCVQVWTDGNSRDAAAGGDLITISGNLFKDSFYGALVGASHDLKDNQIPLMRVTFYRNVFDNIERRSPRASELSRVHVLNNVVKNWGSNSCSGGFGASSKTGAQLFLENNLFSARDNADACKVAIHLEGGYVRATGNVASNGAIIRQKWPDGVFDPRKAAPEYYEYTAPPMTAGLQSEVENSVGPRLGGPVTEIP